MFLFGLKANTAERVYNIVLHFIKLVPLGHIWYMSYLNIGMAMDGEIISNLNFSETKPTNTTDEFVILFGYKQYDS